MHARKNQSTSSCKATSSGNSSKRRGNHSASFVLHQNEKQKQKSHKNKATVKKNSSSAATWRCRHCTYENQLAETRRTAGSGRLICEVCGKSSEPVGVPHAAPTAVADYSDCGDCPLCLESQLALLTVPLCGCRLCSDCLCRFVRVSLRSHGSADRLACPVCSRPDSDTLADPGCEYFPQLRSLLAGRLSRDLMQQLDDRLRDWRLERSRNFMWCSGCAFGFEVDDNVEELAIRCPHCGKETCRKCGMAWHERHRGVSCQQFGEWRQQTDLSERGLAQFLESRGGSCPKCGFQFELSRGGCLHLTCRQCKAEFCSDCGSLFVRQECCGGNKGLHCHHGSECVETFRDWPLEKVRQTALDRGVELELVGVAGAVGRCSVQEQKETTGGGLEDGECGRPVVESGLCESHLKEALASAMRGRKVKQAVTAAAAPAASSPVEFKLTPMLIEMMTRLPPPLLPTSTPQEAAPQQPWICSLCHNVNSPVNVESGSPASCEMCDSPAAAASATSNQRPGGGTTALQAVRTSMHSVTNWFARPPPPLLPNQSLRPSHYRPPMQSMNSMQPMQSMNSMQPMQSMNSMQPMQSMNSMQPMQSMNSMQPMQSMNSMQPMQSMNSMQPMQSMNSMQPMQSMNSMQPMQSMNSMQPMQSMNSMQPMQSMNSMQPMQSMNSMQPMQSMNSMQPMQSMNSMQPMQSMNSMQPMQSMNSMQPMQSMNSMQPMQSMNSMQPMQSMNSMQPMQPMQSMNSPVPPMQSMNSPVPPMQSMNSPVPPMQSMNSPVPPMQSMNSPVPPMQSMNSPVPPMQSMNSRMQQFTSPFQPINATQQNLKSYHYQQQN
ncbi:hypothetical protein BOX15_Mlig025617g2 [Macrostomum lignano]|uniref:RING-type domain-containing protein n=1 Tax=Macrostomum lignano TaxID=282301 RepID=A0A267FV99_9PLAT|nr:hypothetical protein BOX15_Mlig025617g2 [Macrostomum lignano]